MSKIPTNEEHQQQAEYDAASRLLWAVHNRTRGDADLDLLKEAQKLLKQVHKELKKGQWLK